MTDKPNVFNISAGLPFLDTLAAGILERYSKKPEFLDWRWADLETIADTVVDFKLKVYEQLIIEVKKIIPN